MSTNNKKIERRTHKRFSAKEKTFAVIRSNHSCLDRIKRMSMGEIACAVYKSKPVKVGQIVDMSQGGLSFDYIDGLEPCNEHLELDILSVDEKFYLQKISFKTVRDTKTADEPSFSPITMKKQGVQFVGLTFKQISKLEYFLRNHTAGKVSA